MSEFDTILFRLDAIESQNAKIEAKLDRILELHAVKIDSLESYRDRQLARQPIWSAAGLGVLGLAIRELWALLTGQT